MPQSEEIKQLMKKFFPAMVARREDGLCPFCSKVIKPEEEFEGDALGLKEFELSGLCRSCQAETFGP